MRRFDPDQRAVFLSIRRPYASCPSPARPNPHPFPTLGLKLTEKRVSHQCLLMPSMPSLKLSPNGRIRPLDFSSRNLARSLGKIDRRDVG